MGWHLLLDHSVIGGESEDSIYCSAEEYSPSAPDRVLQLRVWITQFDMISWSGISQYTQRKGVIMAGRGHASIIGDIMVM